MSEVLSRRYYRFSYEGYFHHLNWPQIHNQQSLRLSLGPMSLYKRGLETVPPDRQTMWSCVSQARTPFLWTSDFLVQISANPD